ncbi:basic proline-rich protein-like [Cervus elaphus]|uniref:basic proline-rich protein-like n=1 Tax=Cervus elaphus TaxID=9860 RepID=UPI001CC32D9E|nr:basic proline-rich protein-like [Cervus elaphus]
MASPPSPGDPAEGYPAQAGTVRAPPFPLPVPRLLAPRGPEAHSSGLRPLPAPRAPLLTSSPAPRGLSPAASGSSRHQSGSPHGAPVSSHSHLLLGPLQCPAAPPRPPGSALADGPPGLPSSSPPCAVPPCPPIPSRWPSGLAPAWALPCPQEQGYPFPSGPSRPSPRHSFQKTLPRNPDVLKSHETSRSPLNHSPAPWSHREKEGGLRGLTASDTSKHVRREGSRPICGDLPNPGIEPESPALQELPVGLEKQQDRMLGEAQGGGRPRKLPRRGGLALRKAGQSPCLRGGCLRPGVSEEGWSGQRARQEAGGRVHTQCRSLSQTECPAGERRVSGGQPQG